jgi:hypothetical protein
MQVTSFTLETSEGMPLSVSRRLPDKPVKAVVQIVMTSPLLAVPVR